MTILITNIHNELLIEAREKTRAQSVIRLTFEEQNNQNFVLINQKNASQEILEILNNAFQEDDVELALQPDSLGLAILDSAKEYEIFKKKTIYVVNNDHLEKFKACLC